MMGFLQIYYRCSPPPPLHLQHPEQDSSAPRFSFLIRQPSTQYASGKLLPIRDEIVLFHALVRSIIYLLCFFSRRKAKLNVFQRPIAQETFD